MEQSPPTLRDMATQLAHGLRDVAHVFARNTDMSLEDRERSIGANFTAQAHAALTSAFDPTLSLKQKQVQVLYAEGLFHLAYLYSPQWPVEYARVFGGSEVPYSGDFANYCADVRDLLDATYTIFMSLMGLTEFPMTEPDASPDALDHAAAMCYVRFQPLRADYDGMGLRPTPITEIPDGEVVSDA